MVLMAGFRLDAQNLRRVKKYLRKESYALALSEIDRLKNTEKREVLNYYKGVCLLHLYRQEEALDLLLSVSPDIDDQYYDYLTKAYLENDQLAQAMSSWQKVQKPMTSLQMIDQNLSVYKKLDNERKSLIVQNMGSAVNTEGHEYNGMITKDQQSLVFTARKPGLSAKATDGLAYEQILRTESSSTGKWMKPDLFKEGKSKAHHHDATVQYFDNDSKMVTYHDGDLFLSSLKENGDWTSPQPLDMINTYEGLETHCFINDAFDTIYYATNAYTDQGDLDLYRVHLLPSGLWSEPVALDELNSSLDDDSPYLTKNGVLYFSSKGHESSGGYDVFQSRYNYASGHWEVPENLGFPINSPSDDTYFSTYGKIGYLSSGRKGGFGNLDIYRVFLFDKVNVTGQIINEATNMAVAGAEIRFTTEDSSYVSATDSEGVYTALIPIYETVNIQVYHDSMKLYEESIHVKINAKDYTDNVLNLTINPQEGLCCDAVMIRDVVVTIANNDTLVTESLITTNWDKLEAAPYIDEQTPDILASVEEDGDATSQDVFQVYFDFDESGLTEEATSSLEKVISAMGDPSVIKVVVTGHADLVGSSEYNKKLSLSRAKTVESFLENSGLDCCIEVQGKGENEPVVNVPFQNQLNRRVEIALIKEQIPRHLVVN